MPAPSRDDIGLLAHWSLSATAASVAETVTLPIDVTKVRLQLQGELSAAGAARRLGPLQMARSIVQSEGPSALFRGLPAALLRQSVYGGIGIGLYKPMRALMTAEGEEASLAQRIAAGACTGGFGQLVVSPLDVVKVRLQADGRLRAQGQPARYRGTRHALRAIPAQEGWRALLRGLGPSVSRAMAINGAGIATYDTAKGAAKKVLGADGEHVGTHVLSSMISGIVTALISSPFDVVKTRLMASAAGGAYDGVFDCLSKTVRGEGVLALYKGLVPTYARLGPWQLVFFTTYEQVTMWYTGSAF